MLIYLFVFSASCFFIYIAENLKGNIKYFLYFLSILIPSLLAGMRDLTIGTDVLNYAYPIHVVACNSNNFFSYLSNPDLAKFEKGYLTFAYITAKLDKDIFLNLFLTEFLTASCFLIGLIHFKKKRPISISLGMLIFYLLFFNPFLNAIRQGIAMGLVFIDFIFLIKRRWITYVFIICIAMLFHVTAFFGFIPLIVYLAVSRKKFENKELVLNTEKKKVLNKAFINSIIIICITEIIALSPTLLQSFFNKIGLVQISSFYLSQDHSFSLSHLAMKIPYLMILGLQWKYLKKTKLRYFYLTMTLIDFCIAQIVGTSTYGFRIEWYSTMYYVYSLPDEINAGSRARKNTLEILFIAYLLVSWYVMFAVRGYHHTIPYLLR